MSSIKKVVFLGLFACSLSFCVTKQNYQMDFPQEIAAAYFQKANSGEGQAITGTNFYIVFENPLDKEIVLDKIYFRNQVEAVHKESDLTFVAHFNKHPANQDLVLDSNPVKEYGNKAPIIVKPKFDLKPSEAVLEYKNNNKTFFHQMKQIKERPMIANPSGIKPKK